MRVIKRIFAIGTLLTVLILPAKVSRITQSKVFVVTPNGNEWSYRADSPDLQVGDRLIIEFSENGEILNAW